VLELTDENFEREVLQADRPVIGGPQEGGEGLEEEKEAAGGQELVDGCAAEDGGDDQQVHGDAERGAEDDGGQAAEPHRPAVDLDQEVDEVHAEHDEVDVGDPHDVDDAEDQVEAQREQGEDAAEQDAVDRGLGQEYGVDHRPTYAFRTKSCSAISAARPSILTRPTSSR